MTEEENIDYYKNYYRENYTNSINNDFIEGLPFSQSHLGLEIYNAVVRYDLLERMGILAKGKTALDIGSSIGALPAYLHVQGLVAFGVELSDFGDYTKSLFGLDAVFKTSIEDFSTNMKFDIITLCDVFEHVANPQKVLAKVRSLMKDDGVLLIEVPDFFKPHGGVYGFLSNAHLYTYTRKSMTNTLNLAGFEVTHFEYGGYCQNMRLILKKGTEKPVQYKETFEEISEAAKRYNRVQSAVMEFNQGRLSLPAVEQAIAQNLPNYHYLNKMTGLHALRTGNLEQAEHYLTKCLDEDFNEEMPSTQVGNIHGLLAITGYNKGNFDSALFHCNKARELLPKFMEFPFLDDLAERNLFNCENFIEQIGLTYFFLEEIESKTRPVKKTVNL